MSSLTEKPDAMSAEVMADIGLACRYVGFTQRIPLDVQSSVRDLRISERSARPIGRLLGLVDRLVELAPANGGEAVTAGLPSSDPT